MVIPPSIRPFWNEFTASLGDDPSDRFNEAFHFDDNAPSADEPFAMSAERRMDSFEFEAAALSDAARRKVRFVSDHFQSRGNVEQDGCGHGSAGLTFESTPG